MFENKMQTNLRFSYRFRLSYFHIMNVIFWRKHRETTIRLNSENIITTEVNLFIKCSVPMASCRLEFCLINISIMPEVFFCLLLGNTFRQVYLFIGIFYRYFSRGRKKPNISTMEFNSFSVSLHLLVVDIIVLSCPNFLDDSFSLLLIVVEFSSYFWQLMAT